jgi:hypothetical protein
MGKAPWIESLIPNVGIREVEWGIGRNQERKKKNRVGTKQRNVIER